jgi:cytochrome P450
LPYDPEGYRCPVGSHIRRANPRNSLPPTATVALANRHRIIRRGRHYHEKRADALGADGMEHGLCFVAINADLQRQFEFIQQTWCNSEKFNGLFDNKDPLVGDNDGTFNMTIPAHPVRLRMCGVRRFVRMRGGGYFFLPSLTALRYLASSPPASSAVAPAPPVAQVNAGPNPEEMIMSELQSLWSAALREEQAVAKDLANLKEILTKKVETLLARPDLIRGLFGFLREHEPILSVPGLVVVSRYDDVLEVLGHGEAFSATEIYAAKMELTTGDFVLGMADTPQYQRERGIMQAVVKDDDVARIQAFAAETARALVEDALPNGRIDAVGQLSRVVPTRLVGWYFGTPGPDLPTLERWMRAIFREIFFNLSNDGGMTAEATTAAAQQNAYLSDLIATRKAQASAGGDPGDDYLSRLVKYQKDHPAELDDDTIRRIIGGTIVGTVDTLSKAIAQALDQLLDRPEVLAETALLARSDDPKFAAYVFEALRFNPQNPFLIRHCDAEYTLAAGTSRVTTIRPGAWVVVGTMSAMFDEAKVANPDVFVPGRPDDNYLDFGYGQHTCFGRHFAGVVIPETIKTLLRMVNLRRAPGSDGQIAYDGAFPNRLMLEIEGV